MTPLVVAALKSVLIASIVAVVLGHPTLVGIALAASLHLCLDLFLD